MALYKNWPEICRIGYQNKLLMLVLASIPIDGSNDIFVGLYTGFGQCFSTEETDGPFPLSVIRELALEASLRHGDDQGADYPESYDILSGLHVPTIDFAIAGDWLDNDWPRFPLPDEEALRYKQGDRVEWKGQSLVVMENNRNERTGDWRICCAPAECIALDL